MKEYNRDLAVKYAEKWALARNSNYYNFDSIGGDCTNFVSQCIYAGVKVMNYNKIYGWYYIDGNRKSPSWTGVEFLYDFLVNNNGVGPVGEKSELTGLENGDVIQLSFDGSIFKHSLIVVNKSENINEIKVAAHTYDVLNKNITNYNYIKVRGIHIVGVR